LGAGSLLITIFLRFEKILSAGSSVGIDQPTGTLSGVQGEDLFAEIFCLKSEKFLLAKNGRA